MKTVGIIGLGLLGIALAKRFLAGGLHVAGHDIRRDCCDQLRALGGQAPGSSEAVAGAADVVALSLPDSTIVEAVITEVESTLAGKLIVDTTTGDPERTAALGVRLTHRGARYIDAAIAGSSRQVENLDVIVMAGGNQPDVAEAESLFRLFAKKWFHIGPCGSGAKAKLVVNLVLGLNRAVLAEALSFANEYGVNPHTALELLRTGPAYSRVMDTKGPKMLDGDFTPEARLRQHHKDVRLILDAGRRCGARLPLSELHDRLLTEAEQLGLGDLDNSAIIRLFDAK